MPHDSAVGQTPFSAANPIIVSMEAAAALGYRPAANYDAALVPYVEWMKVNAAGWKTAFPMFGHYPSDPFDYAAEDAALAS